MSPLKSVLEHLNITGELFVFLWQHKLWWMIPFVFLLVLIGLLAVLGSSTGVGPFIYTLF